jgi:hypothetical protein
MEAAMRDSKQTFRSSEISPARCLEGEQADPSARGAERPAGRGGAAALRLDKRTYLDREQGRWRVILRDYGEGLAEIGWSFIGNKKADKAGKGDSEDKSEHELRAARRARSRLRQLILSAGCNHLLTLTYRENVTDYKQSCQDLSRFVRKVKRQIPGWVYVAVPEKQKRGAWHWHMAVIGRQDVNLLRESWRSVVGEGNIDVKPPRRSKKNRRMGIVAYLSKYLAKGFSGESRELNGHRYRATLGIRIPSEAIAVPLAHRRQVSVFVLDQLRQRAGNLGFVWVDDSGMAGWACSWG